jgi:hypothetical protein
VVLLDSDGTEQAHDALAFFGKKVIQDLTID